MKQHAEEIISGIRERKMYPVYFLMGEEPYFIDLITDHIEKHLLPEELKAFNQQVFYGKDSDIRTILETALRHPMMSEKQVVIVKEAQELKLSTSGEEEKDPFLSYVENPNPATVLVFAYKYRKLDKRTRFYKALHESNHCLLFESEKIKDYKIPDWIMGYFSKKEMSIDTKAAMLLTEHVGNSISNVVNELDKLILSLPGGSKQITAEHIEKYTGYSKDFNVFELQNAIIAGDVKKANRIVFHFCKNPKDHPLTVTIAVLYQFFVKILLYHAVRQQPRGKIAAALKVREFFLKDYEKASHRFSVTRLAAILSALRKTDARSKGIGNISSSPCDLLKELLFYILH